MSASRRDLIKLVGMGAATLAAAGNAAPVFAQDRTAAGNDPASKFERELKIVNFELLEEEAKKVISARRFAFMGPAGAGVTYRENLRAFNNFPIMPRRLQGITAEAIDLRVKLLGHDLPIPMITCPMGSHGRFHVNAEVATSAGTGMAGTLYVSSGAANKPMEDIAKATTGPKWFQIYMNRDMEINGWLCQRAKAAGFSAIVFTADALGPNPAEEYVRLGSYVPPDLTNGNHDPKLGGKGRFPDFKRDLSLDDIGFLREASGLPVVVKGIFQPDDIRQSMAAGAAAIWVSNHGGRQLDGVPAAISVLGPAADVVGGKVPIIFDSGIRRGIDVFKALALGATVVAVGRPALWGLINGGALGVKSVYTHITNEMKAVMLLSGVAKAVDIKREHIARAS